MTALDDRVVHELVHGGETLTIRDAIAVMERHHPDERAGVAREAVTEYVDALAARRDFHLDADEFLADIDEQSTDAETWEDAVHVYELDDDRLSAYPASWHERLSGTADPREYVEFIRTQEPEFTHDVEGSGPGPGVPQQPLLDAMAAVGGVDREEARSRIDDLRDRGALAEHADQHPNAGVILANEDGEYRDSTLGEDN